MENMSYKKETSSLKNIFVCDLDTPSRYGRIYPKEVMEKAIEKYVKKTSANLFGCLGNSDGPMGIMDLSKVAYLVTNLCIKEQKLFIDIRILDTPNGTVIRALVEGAEKDRTPIPFYFYPVGTGDLAEDGTISNYDLITIDASLIEAEPGVG